MDMIYMVWTQESACMMVVGTEKTQSVAQGGVSYHSETHFSCKISIHMYSLQRIALNFMLHNMEKSG